MSEEFGELFNSQLEAGIRAVVVLENLRPVAADLSEMVLFDHIVVHSADIGGPKSLHADVPGRKGELLVRRRLVEAGLDLMRRCHLVEKATDDNGFVWRASDDAASYVELLETKYSEHLKTCAVRLATEVRRRSKEGFKEYARERLGDWGESFGTKGGA
ncbi:ABC-three component system middle component 2 [Rhizobium skierniewicense]|nr:ABC-three component system middle component 2 [Rhizobium skierniewicense]